MEKTSPCPGRTWTCLRHGFMRIPRVSGLKIFFFWTWTRHSHNMSIKPFSPSTINFLSRRHTHTFDLHSIHADWPSPSQISADQCLTSSAMTMTSRSSKYTRNTSKKSSSCTSSSNSRLRPGERHFGSIMRKNINKK